MMRKKTKSLHTLKICACSNGKEVFVTKVMKNCARKESHQTFSNLIIKSADKDGFLEALKITIE